MVKSFIVDLSLAPHEQLAALEHEVEYLRNVTGAVSPPNFHDPGWERPQSLFHNRANDQESEDPDTELEDLSEVSSMTGYGTPKDIDLTTDENLAGEDAYLIMKAAQHAFRRHTPKGYRKGFRRFTKKGKQFKSKGKGKFRKGSKGRKGFRRSFFNSKFKDSRQGKGNRGKTNPLGKDGKPMKCSICDSIEHFRADCPKGPGGGKSHLANVTDQSRGTSAGWANTLQLSICDDQGAPGHWHVQSVAETPPPVVAQYVSEYEEFLAEASMSWPVWETLTSSIVSLPKSSSLDPGDTQGVHFGTSDKLKKGEAMLLDTGAFNNLVGSQWVDRMDRLNQRCGLPSSTRAPLGRTVTLGGVGKNTQESSHSVRVPTSVNGDKSTFTATVVDGSDLPALLGMKTLRDNRSVLDLENDRLIMPQPGQTIQIVYPPGTKVLQLERAPGGFLMLPCSPDSTTQV